MASFKDPTAEKSDAPVKRGTWESVILMTPVVMTIFATLLAGMSSSEMTKAQYHRSLAGQNQSKVGDQWGFFQAKRVRGTAMEMGVDLLPIYAKPGPLQPEMLKATAARLARQLTEARAKVAALKEASTDKNLTAAADAFLKEVDKNKPANFLKKLDSEVDKGKDAFQYLGTTDLPKSAPLVAEDKRLSEAINDPKMKAAMEAIGDFKPEAEIDRLVREVNRETVRGAIEASELEVKAFDAASKPVQAAIKAINGILSGPLRAAALYHYLVLSAEEALPSGSSSANDTLKSAVKAVVALEAPVRSAAEDLNHLFKAVQHDYTARRYGLEGKLNQNTAMAYEVQVHRSSADSDGHRTKSGYFFFGMLGAQCGVAIGSIALAARRKSLLWCLAALAGLGAIGFSGYVYMSQ